MMKTLPLAVKVPAITVESIPVTRLRTIEVAAGWTKSRVSPLATEKRSQSMTALSDVVTVVALPDAVMVAVPETTLSRARL